MEYATIPIDLIDPHGENPRQHPDEQIAGLEESYEDLGQFRSFVVWKRPNGRYTQVTSHGIMMAMRGRGATHVRVEVLPEDTDPLKVKRIMLADNLHAQKSHDDNELLAALLQEQQDAGFDLSALGSDDESLRQMLEALGDEYIGGNERDEEEDALPEEVETRARVGDMWALGKHKLYVGDSTDAGAVQRLMQDRRAVTIITDPPYGIIAAEWDKADLRFVPILRQFVERNATIALFCSLPFGFDMHRMFIENGWQWRWGAVWTKVSGGFRVGDYVPRYAHEHIFSYTPKEAVISNLIFNGWDAGEDGEPWARTSISKVGETHEVYRGKKSLTYSEGQEDGKRWIRSVLEGKEKPVMPHADRTPHPTQKPLEVITKLVTLLSHAGNLVYDPFLGSGTTLIACENLDRRCIGCELEPKHADIILARYEAEAGQAATLLERAPGAEHV
jgi:DNA modification methylase